MAIEINGIAHIALTVKNFESAVIFYEQLLPFLGLEEVWRGEESAYFIGGRTAVAIQKTLNAGERSQFSQNEIGLHHFCFRARSREDVDTAANFLKQMGATLITGPAEGSWAPGYYHVTFQDPEGIRLEINFVPGKGVLSESAAFDPSGDYV